MSSDKCQPTDRINTLSIRLEPDEASSPHALVEELVRWFTDHGGQLSDEVEIVYSNPRGFHMQATKPLNSPVVVTCPLELTLSCLNLDPGQKEVRRIDSPLQQCQGKIPDHILTYLLLIEQQKKGEDSPWHAYIACLPGPEDMTTPLWFNKDDMTFMAGTSLAPAAKERKAGFHQQWENAINVMRRLRIALADEVDFRSLLWAATIFTSRAFISTHILPDQETVPILFPVADILNHSASAKVEWAFEPHQSFSLKLLDGKTFAPGQELFNNYAPKQNDELLLGYGFCLEDNPIEQFPLRLAFPPMMLQYALEADLFNPENIPFSMSTNFLTEDADTEQHFLRAKSHPFGRYDNCIPFFRGVPPYIVHFFFIQTLLSLDLDIREINIQRPGARITMQILTLLHQAISQRSQNLPFSIPQQPTNAKQRYAKIYRDGQAKIIHSIRLELQSAIDRLRSPAGQVPSDRAVLITPTEALAVFSAELSLGEPQRFNSGLAKHNLHPPSNGTLVWTLLLVCFAAYSLICEDHEESLINAWLHTLYTQHQLPALEDGIEDIDTYTFVDDHLSDFLKLPYHEDDADWTEVLDNIGEKLGHGGVAPREGRPALLSGRTENLGVRIIMWAMKAVDAELVAVLDGEVARKCLFINPWAANDDGDRQVWMYEDVTST